MKASLYISSSKYLALKKLVIFLLIVAATDFCIGKLVRNLYFSQKSGLYYRTTYAIDTAIEDIVIFGNSRANHHYKPDVIASGLGMSCYNAGRDGQSLLYIESIIRAAVKRYNPKIAIIDITEDMFKPGNTKYDRLSSLLPYYKTHPEIRNIILMKSKYEPLKLISDIYPFNSMILTIAKYNIADEIDINGYIPLNRKMKSIGSVKMLKGMDSQFRGNYVDFKTVDSLERIISFLKIHNISIYLFISPYLCKTSDSDFVRIIKRVASQRSIYFFDFSNLKDISRNPKLFADPHHLNNDGATVYSKIITDIIEDNNYMLKSPNKDNIM